MSDRENKKLLDEKETFYINGIGMEYSSNKNKNSDKIKNNYENFEKEIGDVFTKFLQKKTKRNDNNKEDKEKNKNKIKIEISPIEIESKLNKSNLII